MIRDAIQHLTQWTGSEEVLRHLSARMRGGARLFRSAPYPVHRSESLEPFFVVGSGRCGTTLLRRLLQASPEVHIPPENWTLGQCIASFRGYHWILDWGNMVDLLVGQHILMNHRWFDEIPTELRKRLMEVPDAERSLARLLDIVYRYHGEYRKATFERWGDKTPANVWYMEQILDIFPRAKFIHLIRDGVDVVHSWSNHDQYRGEVVRPAKRWKSAVTTAMSFAEQHADRFLEVRYEDLCRKPEETLSNVCRFIDLSYDPDMLSRTDHYSEMEEAHSIEHYGNAFESISTDSIGKGRRFLTQVQKKEIAAVIGDELDRQGYAPVQA